MRYYYRFSDLKEYVLYGICGICDVLRTHSEMNETVTGTHTSKADLFI